MFEDIRAAFNAALDRALGDASESASLMREAVIEAKTSVQMMREGIERTESKLASQRKHYEDAARRGGMAEDIGDTETAEIARKFAAKHAAKVAVLERKLAAQREELEIAEREVAEMTDKLKAAQDGRLDLGSIASRPEPTDGLGAQIDQGVREDAAEAQLQELKKKMGK
ncbi:MAG: hypothetical protein ACE5FJ_02645 [Gemmatimonadales bacterium]